MSAGSSKRLHNREPRPPRARPPLSQAEVPDVGWACNPGVGGACSHPNRPRGRRRPSGLDGQPSETSRSKNVIRETEAWQGRTADQTWPRGESARGHPRRQRREAGKKGAVGLVRGGQAEAAAPGACPAVRAQLAFRKPVTVPTDSGPALEQTPWARHRGTLRTVSGPDSGACESPTWDTEGPQPPPPEAAGPQPRPRAAAAAPLRQTSTRPACPCPVTAATSGQGGSPTKFQGPSAFTAQPQKWGTALGVSAVTPRGRGGLGEDADLGPAYQVLSVHVQNRQKPFSEEAKRRLSPGASLRLGMLVAGVPTAPRGAGRSVRPTHGDGLMGAGQLQARKPGSSCGKLGCEI